MFEKYVDVRCTKYVNGRECGSSMYEGSRSVEIRKSVWQCKKYNCTGKRSVRTKDKFFLSIDTSGRHQYRLELHLIIELIYLWLFTTSTIASEL